MGRTEQPQGKLYEFKPEVIREKLAKQGEFMEFIEMCFEPDSPMNERLKQALFSLLSEKR